MQMNVKMAVAACVGASLLAGCDPDEFPKFVTGPDTIVVEGMTNLVVRGVEFDHAGTNGAAAVVVRDSKNVRFENCSFRHVGGWGVEFGRGAVNCSVAGCEFSDLGAGAVRIGCEEGGATGCVVEQCLVERGGMSDPSSAGIMVGDANLCRISHNTMRGMRCRGIVCGVARDRVLGGACRNLVEFNDVSVVGGSADSCGIATFGEQPGTKVFGNCVRIVGTARGQGLVLGNGSSFVHAVSNYVACGESAALFLGCNTASNVVAGNSFVGGLGVILRRSSDCAGQESPTSLRDNVFWWNDPDAVLAMRGTWDDDYFSSEGNIYCVAGSPVAQILPGFCRAEIPMPVPPEGVGRKSSAAVAASDPEVPVAFQPPAERREGDVPGAALSNEFVYIVFDEKGCLASLRERATGRELVGEKVPFMTMRLEDGSEVAPESMWSGGGILGFVFPDGRGECRLEVSPFDGGWTFRTAHVSLKGAAELVLGRVVPSCGKAKGPMSNVVADDRSAVVLRAYQCELDMGDGKGRDTFVRATRELGFFDRSFGLAAGPADRILAMLGHMAEAADVANTGCGGPRSMESDANRRSCLFAPWPDGPSMDDWLRLADKAGCQALCFDSWWKDGGEGNVAPCCFKDDDEMAAAVERVHECGKKAILRVCPAAIRMDSAPGSQQAEDATDRISDIYNECLFDGIRIDDEGAATTRYGTDWMRERTIEKLGLRYGALVCSSSACTPFSWWTRSFAEGSSGPADLLRRSLGFSGAEPWDFGCRAAAADATVSVSGVAPTDGPLEFAADERITLFGWWERPRYARAFKAGLLERMKQGGFRIWQGDSGEWMVSQAVEHRHLVESRESAKWNVECASGAMAEIRVASLVDDSSPTGRTVMAKGASVAVGTQSFAVPFELPKCHFAQLKGGVWTHYVESGDPVESFAATNAAPRLEKGANTVAFEGVANGSFAPAEVTLVAVGEPEPAFGPLSAEQKKLLGLEYEMPCVVRPMHGLAGKLPVHVRPGEKAVLGFEILGPARYPVVAGRRIPIVLKSKFDRVGCYDGVNWQAVRIHPGVLSNVGRAEAAYRESLGEGVFSRPFETLGPGTAEIEYSDEYGVGARVTLFKKYVVE